jgi:hypothetical protein
VTELVSKAAGRPGAKFSAPAPTYPAARGAGSVVESVTSSTRSRLQNRGQSPLRFDIPAKAFGTLDYITDAKVRRMVHGRML